MRRKLNALQYVNSNANIDATMYDIIHIHMLKATKVITRALVAEDGKQEHGPPYAMCCNMRGEREECHAGENGQTFHHQKVSFLFFFSNFFFFKM